MVICQFVIDKNDSLRLQLLFLQRRLFGNEVCYYCLIKSERERETIRYRCSRERLNQCRMMFSNGHSFASRRLFADQRAREENPERKRKKEREA